MLWPWPNSTFWLDLVWWSARPNTAWKRNYRHKHLSSIFHGQSPNDSELLPTSQICHIYEQMLIKSSFLLVEALSLLLNPLFSDFNPPFFSRTEFLANINAVPQGGDMAQNGLSFHLELPSRSGACWIRSEASAIYIYIYIIICIYVYLYTR